MSTEKKFTKKQLESKKKKIELLLQAEKKPYDVWLFEQYEAYEVRHEDTVIKALQQLNQSGGTNYEST